MNTLELWILKIAKDEPIEAVVIGSHSDKQRNEGVPIGKILTWTEAAPYLRYSFHSGYGGADCHPIEVYTPTKIIFVTEYDGSTSPGWLPRHPISAGTEPWCFMSYGYRD